MLEAALSLFREYGYNATTVEDITERADVAKGTFFNYFSSKEALLNELSVLRIEKLRTALDVEQGAPASPLARLKLLMRLSHRQVADDVRLFQRAFAARLVHPPPPPHRAKHHILPFVDDLVAEAQACGEIRADADPEVASDLIRIVFFRRMMLSCEQGGELPPVEEIEEMVDLLMTGLAGPQRRVE